MGTKADSMTPEGRQFLTAEGEQFVIPQGCHLGQRANRVVIGERDKVEPLLTGRRHQILRRPTGIGMERVAVQIAAIPAGIGIDDAREIRFNPFHRRQLGSGITFDGYVECVIDRIAWQHHVRVNLHCPFTGRQRTGQITGRGTRRGDLNFVGVTTAVAGPAEAVGVKEGEGEQIGHAADTARCIVEADCDFGAMVGHMQTMGNMSLNIGGGEGSRKLLVCHT